MASEVKRQKILAEEVIALPDRYNWNIGSHARLLRRTFSLAVSATRLQQTASNTRLPTFFSRPSFSNSPSGSTFTMPVIQAEHR
jgi:hypothetical protein